jgi:hypothetical protein
MRYWLLCALPLALACCAPATGPQIVALDGSPVNPASYEPIETGCRVKARAAGVAVPPSDDTIARARQASEARDATFALCMAERGFKVTRRPADFPPESTATASVR